MDLNMFFNGEDCDLYIGKSAGKMLLRDIEAARRSVKIISPYLSAKYVSHLIELHNYHDVKVRLITMDGINDNQSDQNLYRLIRQHRSTDQEALRVRKIWRSIHRWTLIASIVLGVLSVSLTLAFEIPGLLYIALPAILAFAANRVYHSKLERQRVYTYDYSQLFPFKVFHSEEYSRMIHCKLYIIDEQVAYLGSLNFTVNGLHHNLEARVKIKNPEAVAKLSDYFEALFHNRQWTCRDLQQWGRTLYSEPLN